MAWIWTRFTYNKMTLRATKATKPWIFKKNLSLNIKILPLIGKDIIMASKR